METFNQDKDLAAHNHRPCTDEEYNTQRNCWNCRNYSFKSYSDDDHNAGKCFTLNEMYGPICWTNATAICDRFKHDAGQIERSEVYAKVPIQVESSRVVEHTFISLEINPEEVNRLIMADSLTSYQELKYSPWPVKKDTDNRAMFRARVKKERHAKRLQLIALQKPGSMKKSRRVA